MSHASNAILSVSIEQLSEPQRDRFKDEVLDKMSFWLSSGIGALRVLQYLLLIGCRLIAEHG